MSGDNTPVWCGVVVWCRVVGVVWCGVGWCGVVWCGVWCGGVCGVVVCKKKGKRKKNIKL